MDPSPDSVDLLPHLIPSRSFITGFSTCESISHPHLTNVKLADTPLGVHKVIKKTTHNVVTPPSSTQQGVAPKTAWEAVYPKGSINPSAEIPGGFGFYLNGPLVFQEALKEAHEVIFSYRVMLQKGWKWVKGGKLPGMVVLGIKHTNARVGVRTSAANVLIFDPCGASALGELYAYLPLTKKNKEELSSVPPLSIESGDYGMSVGRGAYTYEGAVGSWIAVAIRLKLNDIGVDNGEVEMFIDGKSIILAKGVCLRCSKESGVKGMHFQTFFGGHTDDWASPDNQHAWFADVTGAILA